MKEPRFSSDLIQILHNVGFSMNLHVLKISSELALFTTQLFPSTLVPSPRARDLNVWRGLK